MRIELRSGCPYRRNKNQDCPNDMRDDGNKTCQRSRVGKSRKKIFQYDLFGQNQPSEGICLRQHSDCVLGDELCNGNVGRRKIEKPNNIMDSQGVKNVENSSGKTDIKNSGEIRKGEDVESVPVFMENVKNSPESNLSEVNGVGAPHIRQRLWFMAQSEFTRIGGRNKRGSGTSGYEMEKQENRENTTDQSGNGSKNDGFVAHADGGSNKRRIAQSSIGSISKINGEMPSGINLANPNGDREIGDQPGNREGGGPEQDGQDGRTSDSGISERPRKEDGRGAVRDEGTATTEAGVDDELADPGSGTSKRNSGSIFGEETEIGKEDRNQHGDLPIGHSNGGSINFWSTAVWLPCRDGKYRPTGPGIPPLVGRAAKPGTEPVADGHTPGMVHSGDQGQPEDEINPDESAEARVMRLRGYGNAIVVPLAAEFIRVCMEVGLDRK